MESFKSILVDIDATAATHPALDRAVLLARASGASVTIVDTMPTRAGARAYLPSRLQEQILNRRSEALERVARGVVGVPARSLPLSGRPATALVREVLESGHDLLLRSHARDLVARPLHPYGAVDMELLRQCPCPVMIVGPGAWSDPPRILAAVDSSTEHAAERDFNAKIVELALLAARLTQGSVQVVQAWLPFAEHLVRTYTSEADYVDYLDDVRRRTRDDLSAFVASFGHRLTPAQATHVRGAPEEVITEFIVSHGIDLTVIGTVARSGIAGLLIGNTAERILRRLPCSVLAVKPDGFVSPVRVDAPD